MRVMGESNEAETVDRSRVVNLILGTETNANISSAPVLELHHPIMSILGGQGCRLDIYI